jgi:hypothetical protein
VMRISLPSQMNGDLHPDAAPSYLALRSLLTRPRAGREARPHPLSARPAWLPGPAVPHGAAWAAVPGATAG